MVPGKKITLPAMDAPRVTNVGDAAAGGIDAAPEADGLGEDEGFAGAGAAGNQDFGLQAHAATGAKVGRPETALSTQSASEP
jgi:hypothetical protein